jgi:anaphase-promoting complex subunit 3
MFHYFPDLFTATNMFDQASQQIKEAIESLEEEDDEDETSMMA